MLFCSGPARHFIQTQGRLAWVLALNLLKAGMQTPTTWMRTSSDQKSQVTWTVSGLTAQRRLPLPRVMPGRRLDSEQTQKAAP